MNLLYLLAHVPLSAWLAFLASVVLPGASAALVRAHWDASVTGVLTVGLSTATGFVTEWIHDGDSFRWQSAAALALASWIIAALAQSKILSGTQLEGWLLTLGSQLPDGTEADHDPTLLLAEDEPPAVTPADPGQPAAGVPPAAHPHPHPGPVAQPEALPAMLPDPDLGP